MVADSVEFLATAFHCRRLGEKTETEEEQRHLDHGQIEGKNHDGHEEAEKFLQPGTRVLERILSKRNGRPDELPDPGLGPEPVDARCDKREERGDEGQTENVRTFAGVFSGQSAIKPLFHNSILSMNILFSE